MNIVVNNNECVGKKSMQGNFWRRTCQPYEPVRADFMPVFAVHLATCHLFVSTDNPEASYTRSEGSAKISCYKIRRKLQVEHLNVSGQKVEEKLTPCQEKCHVTITDRLDFFWICLMMTPCHQNLDVFILRPTCHLRNC
jgi:hypothetical protein